MTQSFVSRKHMEIFGYYFPDEIINWCIDDWISEVYQPNYYFPLKKFVKNLGGNPRYIVNNELNLTYPLMETSPKRLVQ